MSSAVLCCDERADAVHDSRDRGASNDRSASWDGAGAGVGNGSSREQLGSVTRQSSPNVELAPRRTERASSELMLNTATEKADEASPNGTFASLRVPNFRRYAAGQVVALVGNWVQRTGQEWLVLEISGGSPLALGIAVALQFLPMLMFTLWAGALADRLDKRKLLIGLQCATGACALVLGLLTVTGAVTLWHIYILCFALGCATSMDLPVRQSFVIEMVGAGLVGNAVALNSMIFNSARIVGPAIAGYLIALIGTGWLFLLNAVGVGAVIAALALMNPSLLHRDERRDRGRGTIGEGLRRVRQDRGLTLVLALVCCVGTFGLNFNATLGVMARSVFELGSSGFGLLHSMLAAGTFAGAVLAARRGGRPRLRLLVLATMAFGALEVTAGLMPHAAAFAAVLVTVGIAQMTFILTANNTVQLSVDSGIRGRVMAIYMLSLLGGMPLGATLAGWTAEHIDERAPLLIGGTITFLAGSTCAAIALRRLARTRRETR